MFTVDIGEKPKSEANNMEGDGKLLVNSKIL